MMLKSSLKLSHAWLGLGFGRGSDRLNRRGRRLFGKGEVERCALLHFALDPGLAAVSLNDMFDYGQPQPRAALLARAGAVHAVEALEDAAQRIGRNAGAVVGHEDLRLVPGVARADGHASAGLAVLDGIVCQVEE